MTIRTTLLGPTARFKAAVQAAAAQSVVIVANEADPVRPFTISRPGACGHDFADIAEVERWLKQQPLTKANE